jgi:hypothetical protein
MKLSRLHSSFLQWFDDGMHMPAGSVPELEIAVKLRNRDLQRQCLGTQEALQPERFFSSTGRMMRGAKNQPTPDRRCDGFRSLRSLPSARFVNVPQYFSCFLSASPCCSFLLSSRTTVLQEVLELSVSVPAISSSGVS